MELHALLSCTEHVAVLMGKASPAADDNQMVKQQNPMDLAAVNEDTSM
eukprot:COSAG02_NODE_24045_length_699_cov_1.260000_1_plen_47_part_10